MKLKTKVALITGGGTGIGRAIALLFAKEGANVVITYLKNEKEAKEVLMKIKGLRRKALALKCDVRNYKEVDYVVKKTIEELGRIDILVNNAGMWKPRSFLETSNEIWEETIAINLTGVFNCTKAAIPNMIMQKHGKIINISSIAGISGSLVSVPYAAAKAGVIALTRTLARDFAKYNISVNSIAPGPVRTDFLLKHIKKSLIEKVTDEIPMGRIAEPEDIAGAVLFFASNDSDYITGQTLIVDGGRI